MDLIKMQKAVIFFLILLSSFPACSFGKKSENATPMPDPNYVEIRIKCYPQIANFYFDDYNINGKGELFDAKKGKHRVRAILTGYETFEQEFEINENFELEVRLNLIPTETPFPTSDIISSPLDTPTPRAPVKPETKKRILPEATQDTHAERLARRMTQGVANGYDWREMSYLEKKLLCITIATQQKSLNLDPDFLYGFVDEYYLEKENLREKLQSVITLAALLSTKINEESDE
jgi:hypothetical protein